MKPGQALSEVLIRNNLHFEVTLKKRKPQPEFWLPFQFTLFINKFHFSSCELGCNHASSTHLLIVYWKKYNAWSYIFKVNAFILALHIDVFHSCSLKKHIYIQILCMLWEASTILKPGTQSGQRICKHVGSLRYPLTTSCEFRQFSEGRVWENFLQFTFHHPCQVVQ
jgi:hypothetical protein